MAAQHPELGVEKIETTTLGQAPARAGASRPPSTPRKWLDANQQMVQQWLATA